MRPLVGALGTILLVLAGASSQAAEVSRHVLGNGLTVLVRQIDAAPVVALSLQIRAGSRFETPATAGTTNFLQRVLIRGTTKRSALELAEAVEDLGGTLDASGDVETAEIRAQALARHWDDLLRLVVEVVREPAFPPAEVERERGLILSAIQTRADNPFPLSVDTLLGELYGEHPHAWPAIGTRPAILRVTREALIAHYRETYRADRMVLAVSGQVPRESVVRLAARFLGDLPRAPGSVAPRLPAPADRGVRTVVARPAKQAQVLVGYLGPGLGEPDYAAMRVLGAVLGAGMSGRLFVELRDRRGLAYSLGVLSPVRTDRGFLATYLGTAKENIAAAEAGMLAELDRLRHEPVTDAELARAKAYLRGALTMDRRTNARRAWSLAFYEAVGAGWEFPDRYLEAVSRVAGEDVTAAARRYLARPTIVVLEPSR